MLTKYQSFKIGFWNWVRNSGTILWARLQILVGSIWVVLMQTDLSTVLQPKYMTYWLIFSGVVTELVRRKGTVVETQVVATEATNFTPVEVKKLVVVEPAPPPQG